MESLLSLIPYFSVMTEVAVTTTETAVTSGAIDVSGVETFIENLYENVAVILALVGTVFVFVSRISKMFSNITSVIKEKVDHKDIEGLAEELKHIELLVREIKELQDVSAVANIDNKFLDEDTKKAFAQVLNDYNTVETLTKEQWKKVKDYLTFDKEE
jgi:hypothetical protein